MKKYLHMLFFIVAVISINQACWIVAHQPEFAQWMTAYDRLDA